ncbi:hypothetical protein IFM47457_06987 [Aspergillus lentulus]|nr:hypothetical protein IFM47457_06987 [Aspergillus lentulus]
MPLSNSISAPSVRWEISYFHHCQPASVDSALHWAPHKPSITSNYTNTRKMRDMPSRFIEILDPSDNLRFSDSDVRLEDVLADHEAIVTRPRSATKTSDRSDRDNSSSSGQRWKRLSTILITPRRPSTS